MWLLSDKNIERNTYANLRRKGEEKHIHSNDGCPVLKPLIYFLMQWDASMYYNTEICYQYQETENNS